VELPDQQPPGISAATVPRKWMSEELAARVARQTNPVTDVFLVAHGWNHTAAEADTSFRQWMSAMADDSSDIQTAWRVRPRGHFNPLLVGVSWPSRFLDWGGGLPSDVLASALTAEAVGIETGGTVPEKAGAATDAATDAMLATLEDEDRSRVAASPQLRGALGTLAAAMTEADAAAPVAAAAAEVAAGAAAAPAAAAAAAATAPVAAAAAAATAADANAASGTEPLLPVSDAVPPASTQTSLPPAVVDALVTLRRGLSPTPDEAVDASGEGETDAAVIARAHAAFASAAAAEVAGTPSSDAPSDDGDDGGVGGLGARVRARASSVLTATARLMLYPIADVAFASFERRAARIGRTGAHKLLATLQGAAPARARDGRIKFHAVGHSLGAHVCCAMLAGPRAGSQLIARVHAVALIQAAVPATSFAVGGVYRGVVDGAVNGFGDAPAAAVAAAAAAGVAAPEPVAPGMAAGPVVLTHSPTDTALRLYTVWYGEPLGSVGATFPPLAAGSPADAVAADARRAVMTGAKQEYKLTPGVVTSVDAGAFVDEGSGSPWDLRGSHSDIVDDPVSHLVWEAVLTPVAPKAYALGGEGEGGALTPAGQKGNELGRPQGLWGRLKAFFWH